MHSLSAPASRVSPLRGGQGVSASSTTPQATPTLTQVMTAPGDRISLPAVMVRSGAGGNGDGIAMPGRVGDGGNSGEGTYDGFFWKGTSGRKTGIASDDMIRAHSDDNGAVRSFNKSATAKLNYPAGRRVLWSNSIAVSTSRIIATPVLPPYQYGPGFPQMGSIFSPTFDHPVLCR